MYRFALALVVSLALAAPALAQKSDEATKKVAIPANTFFKGQQANQYLAKERLLGAKIVNKDNETIGTIEDLIIGSSDNVDGVVVGVGGFLGVGEKKIGVRMSALKITTADGKTIVSLPAATKEMLGAIGAYQRASAAKK